MNELALFAGAGGGILGGHLLGWRTVCAVEWEPYPASVLCARQNDGFLPPFPVWDDVQTFDGKPWRGIVDVVSGGFPCQDISAAGKGAGIDGERSGMWREMARIIYEVRPRFVFVENSPMLTSRGLGVVLGDLAEMGFDARWGVLGAANVGAPHQRDRIWIVAHANSVRFDSGKHDAKERGHYALRQVWQGEKGSAGRQDGIYGFSATCGAQCGHCDKFFAKYRCNTPDECDCPRCQGYCECNMADTTKLQCNGGNHNARVGMGRESISESRNGGWSEDVANTRKVGFPGAQTKQGLEGGLGLAISSLASGWWDGEPGETPRTVERGLGGVADGVAARVDRLKALGNGQVSEVARRAWELLSDKR